MSCVFSFSSRTTICLARPSPTRWRDTRVRGFRFGRSEERRVGKECRFRWSGYQAEDGIRDLTVTGVQTCALPILTNVRVSGNRLSARMRGNLDIDDTGPSPYELRLQLQLQDNNLFGAAVTYALEGYEGPRLPFWEIGRASCRERVQISVVGVSSRRRHTRFDCDWSSDVCSSDLDQRPRLR